mgnify:CR=1 FL=1|jgi:DNA-binding MarR family transcriptional regulator
MAPRLTYLRFLNFIQALDGDANAPQMDLDAKKLLEVIYVKQGQGIPLTVTDAMALHHIASPATIHRKLDQLRELGMIDTVFEGKNRRTKYLVATEVAHDYFAKLGEAMHKALESN